MDAMAVEFPRPGETTGQWKDPAKAPHPRIWMNAERLLDLRARRPLFGSGTIADALSYLVHRDKDAGLRAVVWARDRAKEMTQRYDRFDAAGNGINDAARDLIGVAIVFDYCNDLLNDTDRDIIVAYVNACHDGLKGKYVEHMDNYLICPMMTGLAALATAERNPRAKEILNHHLNTRWNKTVLPLLKKFGAGGGWWEGEGYGYEYSYQLILFCEAVLTATGRNLYAEAEEFFFDRLRYLCLAIYPLGHKGKRLAFVCGDSALDRNSDLNYLPRAFLANHYKNTNLGAAALDMIFRGYKHEYNNVEWVTAFLSRPPTSVPFQSLPLEHFAVGTGRVLARSSWSEDATTMAFTVHDHISWHDHMESGHFSIYRRDLLTAQSGVYAIGSHQFKSYYKRSIAKNCVSIFLPGEDSWGQYGGHNDGGQAHGGVWSPSWPEWQANSRQYEMGDIVAYGAGDGFVYACGDITAAYSPKKVVRYLRHFLFLRPDTFVVFDALKVTSGALKKTWHLHLFENPSITARGSASVCASGHGEGRIHCITLLPAGHRTDVVKGFASEGVEHSAVISGISPTWRYDVVAPRSDGDLSLFLNVLKATAVSDSAPPECRYIDLGSAIELDISGHWTVRISKSGEPGWSLKTREGTQPLPRGIEQAQTKRTHMPLSPAKDDAAKMEAAVGMWRGRLSQRLQSRVGDGDLPAVYLTLVNRTPERVKIMGSDSQGLSLVVQGNTLPWSWKDVSTADCLNISLAMLKQGSVEDHILVAVFAGALGRTAISEEYLAKALLCNSTDGHIWVYKAREDLGLRK